MYPVTHQPPPSLPSSTTTTTTTTAESPPELRRTKHKELGFCSGDVAGPNTMHSPSNKPVHQTTGSSGAAIETNEEDEEDNVNSHERDEIRVSEEEEDEEIRSLNDLEHEIVAMEAKIDSIVDNLKSINDQIDQNAHSKKPSLSNFWSSASVWSKKLQKWRRNRNKIVVDGNGVVSARTLPPEKTISRQCRETQSEIADYGFGRRSCDTGPRFSLDSGRVSFDEPRGSWDGYLIGRSYPKLPPVVGDASAGRMHISGGSTRTRECYLSGIERSNSISTMRAPVVGDQITGTTVSSSKLSPACIDYSRLKFGSVGGEKELERDEGSGWLGTQVKKQRWWSRKVWWFNRRSANDASEEGEGRRGLNRKVSRSYSSVRWRRSNSVETLEKVYGGGDEFVFEGAKNHGANGLLRFYLTPLRGGNRKLKK